MATQYFCRDEERRELAAAAGRNGIDYLEVLDLAAPDGAPRQRTLLVFFLSPLVADIATHTVSVEGGSRVTGIGVEWTARETTVDPAKVSADELAFYQSVGDNVLIVRTDRYGDHSTYTLEIEGLDPTVFDPLLTRVRFSFKAQCPHGFDCAPDTECPPTPVTEPPIDYLARDYAGLRRVMLDRMSVVMPDWKDREQVPDVQVTLVEAMAYVGDRLSYYQDAVASEAYIGTALQRQSLRRHGRLLDYRLHEGNNARTWIHLEVTGNQPVPITAGTQFMTRLATDTPAVLPPSVPAAGNEPHPYDEALELAPGVFEALDGIVAFAPHSAISLYTWGDEQCCLPTGATRATLVDGTANADRLRLRPGDVVIFEQVKDPVTGLAADADGDARHAVRLTKVAPQATAVVAGGEETDRNPGPLTRDPLPIGGTQQPIVEVEWDERDALPFPLCISEEIDGALRSDLAIARANVVLADHGRTIRNAEELEVGAETRRFRPFLDTPDVTYAAPFPPNPPELPPATQSTLQDPRAALPAVTLDDAGEVWEPALDLLNSDRFARDFVIEPHNDRRAQLRFGDDVKGRRPRSQSTLLATYRVGNGSAGNVGRDSLAHIVAVDGPAHNVIDRAVQKVRNPLPATGGINPEAAGHVRLYAPEAFRTQERAVTESDYAEVTERRRDIQKAAGTRRWTGSWHTMFVTVDRTGGLDVDAAFDADVVRYLDRYRLAGQDVEVDGPRFAPLDIAMTVCVYAGFFRADVKQALLDTLSCRLLPDGRRGFFHPDNLTFGDTLYLSALVSSAMDVTGVSWVDVTRFHRWGVEPDDELSAARIAFDRLEIPQLDNDPNAPENGRLELTMEGGK